MDFLKEQLKDPAIRKEYDVLEAEYALKQAKIDLDECWGIQIDFEQKEDL